jgi:hypothetical protein
MSRFRNGVVSLSAEGVAPADASNRQPETSRGAVGLDSLYRVGRARRHESAAAPDDGGQQQLVSADEENREPGCHKFDRHRRSVIV